MASLKHGRVPGSRPIATREIPLIDRLEEMKLLKEAVDRASQGEGGVVFLHGEAGIGKTRLTRELGAYASLCGMRFLYGRCPALFRMDGVPPYILWSEVIRDYLETCSPELLYKVIGFYPSEIAKLAPEIGRKLGAIPQSLPINPERERDRLFEAVSQFIINISKEAPLLVVLDDLQWTDQTSLLLLHYLARGIYKTPLLLLGAYRETDIDEKHPLSAVLTELNRERLLQSIPLKRMSLNDVSEMIGQILGQDDVPKEFCKLAYEKTRGNPFFVEELIKSLKEEDLIFREGNQWKIKEISQIQFPQTVKGVIKSRISRLDDECQNILTLASFVGNDFTFEALREVTGIEENSLLELMEKLLKTEIIKETVIRGEDTYRFADAIVRDIVHEGVSHLRHKKLHHSVGNALEKAYAKNIDQHFGQLAYHFLEADDKDKALEYFLKAGEKAQQVYAHNEAAQYLQHALELLEKDKASLEQKASVTERLGDVRAWMGETYVSLEYWYQSLALWNQLGNERRVAEIHVKMANLLWDALGDKEKASEHHGAALQILEKEAESVELASLYENISHMLWRTGESTKASLFAHKALEMAEKIGDAKTVADCYNDLAGVTDSFEESAIYYEKGLKIAVQNNCTESALRLYNNLSITYAALGDSEKAFETLRKGFELGKKVGETLSTSWTGRTLAYVYANMGESQNALALLEEMLALGKRIKNTLGIVQSTCQIGRTYQFLGEWDQSLSYLRKGYDLAKGTRDYQTIAETAVFLGELFLEMAEYSEAERYLNEGSDVYEKAGNKAWQFYAAYSPLAKLYLLKGETEKAKGLIESMYEYVTKEKFILAIPRVQMLKGMFFREQKNWEKAAQHFETGLQKCKSLNWQKWYVWEFAEFLYEYGLMYLQRNQEGDNEQALSLLNQAHEIYKNLNAAKKAERTRSRIIHRETAQATSKPEPTEEVSEGIPGHITTGYADLDRLLSGGIPGNYTVALTSPSCDERDLLVKSFLETGAKRGEVAFYVTINPGLAKPLVDDFQSNFHLFVCNPQADAIIKDLPNVLKLKGVENLTEISIALTSTIRKLDPSLKGPRRICIGLISDVLLQHHAVQTRRWLAGLIPELQSEGFTTLAVMDPEMHPSQEVRAVLDLFDGEINIREKETDKGSEKFLKVKRMSNQKYLDDELLFKKEQL